MTSCGSSEDSVLVLQADQVVTIKIEKFSRPFIRRGVFLLNLYTYLLWILIARIRVVDRNHKEAPATIFTSYCTGQVGSEGGNAALPRQMITDKSDARRQRQGVELHRGRVCYFFTTR